MGRTTIDHLIINSPYEEPTQYWHYEPLNRLFSLRPGRRPAGYVKASPDAHQFDDPGVFVEIPLVNQIRPRVKAWREAGYPGVSSITKRLLDHWRDPEEFEARRFFFCQLEAVETLIWLTEAPASERVGIEIPGDGGDIPRQCCKMATGSGKTIVMAMVIAWQVLNRVAYPQDGRFSKNILVVAPGLTVKNRLAVLMPTSPGNYYDEFRIIPTGGDLMDKLRQGKVLVRNWHALAWDSEAQVKKRRSVDKRGVKSDEAYTREVLGEMANARNLLVINDEAHHSWRVSPEAASKYNREDVEVSTVWINGLDRLNRSRGILRCYDFSATPFTPSGKKSMEESLFQWIVSDFGLNDAIESGLVKTPRVVVRDDALPDPKNYKSRFYHIYNDPEVKENLSRPAAPEEPLPDLILNAYYFLGFDWKEWRSQWAERGFPTPPVMITVCNRTETAARVKHAFDTKRVPIDELCDAAGILHIDSKVLKEAEEHEEPVAPVDTAEPDDEPEDAEASAERKLTRVQQAELLRRMVDTVGKPGQPGANINNVISVGMLSEGWDAKTVTHIMGLRAFTSQLLCEQVVGRGLRRTSYEVAENTGLFEPEYVNIFGVPFTFLPHEGGEGRAPGPSKPRFAVEPDPAKVRFEISWPNVLRIERVLRPVLTLDLAKTAVLELDAGRTARIADLAPVLEGKTDVTRVASIELEKLARDFRTQRIVFEATRDVYDQMQRNWPGSREVLLAQLVRLVDTFIRSDRVTIYPPLFNQDELRRRLTITLNMSRVVEHVFSAIQCANEEHIVPVFDPDRPIRSTGDMRTWYTGKPCERTTKSHINLCVFDSTWEASDAFKLDHHPNVDAWAKNDHLGFEILYIFRGVVHKYRPDFLIRLASGEMLVVETKGEEQEKDRVKWQYMNDWIMAINAHGGFGTWRFAVAHRPGELVGVLD